MRTPMRKSKSRNFREVNLGYSDEEAAKEASRCMQCGDPGCIKGCPLEIDIPGFIRCIKNGDVGGASDIIRSRNQFPGITCRTCSNEKLCEKGCNNEDKISIAHLERYASDREKKKMPRLVKRGGKIAVAGSGPAGLSCAHDLALKGYNVTVYEAMHDYGGVLRYSVPDFKLPKKYLDTEIELMKKMGVKFIPNHIICRTEKIDELLNDYDIVFLCTGIGIREMLKIRGAQLGNVSTANEFLMNINLFGERKFPRGRKPQEVAVIGGNCQTLDAARAARRLGANVSVVAQGYFDSLSAKDEDIEYAREEGIDFVFLSRPQRVIGSKQAEGIELIQMMFQDNGNGHKETVPIENTEFVLPCDYVIFANTPGPNTLLADTTNLSHKIDKRIIVDSKYRTSLKNVFAGGAVIGSKSIIKSIYDGKKAAFHIDEYLKSTSYL